VALKSEDEACKDFGCRMSAAETAALHVNDEIFSPTAIITHLHAYERCLVTMST